MATKVQLIQLQDSTTPGAILQTDASNHVSFATVTTGADKIWFYDDSAAQTVMLTVGTGLLITGTTLTATGVGAAYALVQEEGTPVTARGTLNFIGTGITAADDIPNTRTNVTLATFLNTLATQGNVNAATQLSGITPVANGGTGLSSGTSGGNLYYSGSGVIASSGAFTDNVIVVGNGAGAAQTSLAAGLGTTTTVLHGNAAGEPTWGAVSLSADVTGTLGVTNGGTGFSSYVTGDIIVASSSTTLSRVADVATGSVLKSGGIGVIPGWGTLASTDLSNSANIALLNATQTFTGTNTFSNNITMNGTPSATTDVITVGYLANYVANGLKYHSVRGATTSALSIATRSSTTLTVGAGALTVDGVTYVNGDYILVKNDTTGAGGGPYDNGAYVISGVGSSVTLTRASYMDSAGEVDGNTFIVEDGTANAGTLWLTISEVTTLGTNSIVFSQIQTGGTVTSVTVTQPAAGITVTNSGSAQTGATTSTIALANDLAALEALASTGFAARTTTDTWAQRTFQGTSNRISITNPAGIAGDPTFDISTSYAGQASIVTVGPLTSGSLSTGFTAVAVAQGGTGLTTGTSGGVLYFSSSSTVASSAALTDNILVVGGGAGAAPNSIAAGLGTTVQVLHGNAGGEPTWGAVSLTADVSGTLPVTSGGTGLATSTVGGILIGSASNTYTNLGIGTSGFVLKSNGTTAVWAADSTTVSKVYITGSTSTTFVLNTGTPVTDVDGTAVNFTVPTNVDQVFVVRDGITLSRSGTVTRDYTLVGQTLTFGYALTAGETVLIYKIGS